MFALPLWAADPDVGSPLPAVWKEQRLDFSYMGRTARYSCEGLRDKMRSLLLDLGARRDLTGIAARLRRIRALGPRLHRVPRLSLVFSSPALPDAAAKPLHAGRLDGRGRALRTVHRSPATRFEIMASATASWSRSLRARSCRSSQREKCEAGHHLRAVSGERQPLSWCAARSCGQPMPAAG